MLLILIPWSSFWDRNYFAQAMPVVGEVVTNHFVRGAVSGLGVVNLLAALAELLDIVSGSRARRPAPDATLIGEHHDH